MYHLLGFSIGINVFKFVINDFVVLVAMRNITLSQLFIFYVIDISWIQVVSATVGPKNTS